MDLDFDFEQVSVTEFGAGFDLGGAEQFLTVPVSKSVQTALQAMATSTWERLQEDEDGPERYEPSERYGPTASVYIPLADELAKSMRDLHTAGTLELNSEALNDVSSMFCYFARMRDREKRRLTAVRRATQFKGVLRAHLLRFVDDSLDLLDDRVFKLDTDFDLLIDDSTVHVLRPAGFEFAGRVGAAILAAVPQSVRAIKKDLAFVEFATIEKYAKEHSRAARYLASIHSQRSAKRIDKKRLEDLCTKTGVGFSVVGGRICVDEGSEIAFLEVLDRRRYEIELVSHTPERFRAASRKKI